MPDSEIPPHAVSLLKDSHYMGLRTVFTVQMPADKLPSRKLTCFSNCRRRVFSGTRTGTYDTLVTNL
ncbi:hypothetical protein TNCV_3176461 [Trichonephila clavipes]|nr:hypothetical protein TNCV_3176461 [Trichonephila clavipes]